MKKTSLTLSILLILFASGCGGPDLTLEEKIDAAHREYAKKDSGYMSSYLPRPGVTRGDDYRNCIDQKYYRDQDPHDFCSWHAGIGEYRHFLKD